MPSANPDKNPVPAVRLRACNSAAVNLSGRYVLYWMIANRRLNYNFALDRALERCRALRKPLVILEGLRCDYQWASDRFHGFVVAGMADNVARAKQPGVVYYPYVEPCSAAGKGLLEALAEQACLVVTDDFPCFFLPRMVAAAAKRLRVPVEAVDSNGLLPMQTAEQAFSTAHAFRRFLQKALPEHLANFPSAEPWKQSRLPRAAELPPEIRQRWPSASEAFLGCEERAFAKLPIDHDVRPNPKRGGHTAARKELLEFLNHRLAHYAKRHNEPEARVTSELSPYLHFGHISAHEIFAELARREEWKPERLSLRTTGKREGWWNVSPAAESFLDELITWRELGYNFCAHRSDYSDYKSLPAWARKTLQVHRRDERGWTYSLGQLEDARTHDSLWNAAQIQLVREGTIHNYLRMLWGKKILEWTRTPEEAAKFMIHLNDKYAVDGRDPNSYSGIFWTLGRYDRPWGPERPIFGTVRYMSSKNAARKLSLDAYLERYKSKS